MIGYLNGKVEKVLSGNFSGTGIVVVETYKTQDGTEKQNRAVAWFDRDPGFQIGQQVSLKGIVSARINSYTDKQGVAQTRAEVSLNKAIQWKTPEGSAKPLIKEDANANFIAMGATPLEDAPF